LTACGRVKYEKLRAYPRKLLVKRPIRYNHNAILGSPAYLKQVYSPNLPRSGASISIERCRDSHLTVSLLVGKDLEGKSRRYVGHLNTHHYWASSDHPRLRPLANHHCMGDVGSLVALLWLRWPAHELMGS
jgi:hypothetical protein